MARFTAVVAGATGAAGVRLVELLAGNPDWRVVGLCRRPPPEDGRARFLAVDLADRADCRRKLGGLGDATHVFYAARAKHGEAGGEPVAENLAMLRNVVESIEPAAPNLRHLHLVHGTRYYGPHLGPFKTPAKEDDARTATSEFYYEQQDYIAERQRGKAWTWSISRPDVICDFAPARRRNIVAVIAVFAAVSKELGRPLSFPGPAGNYAALVEATEASQLARAIAWMATDGRCANQAFNVTNGDCYRWRNLWPRFAAYFGIEAGPLRPCRLAEFMADKAAVWERVVASHGLQPTPWERTALWEYGDATFAHEYDQIVDMTKARRFGFHDVVDSEEMFVRLFDAYRKARLIP